MKSHLFASFVLLSLVIPGFVLLADDPPKQQAKEESVKPGINKSFLDPDLEVQKWINRFEVESREVFSSRVQIMEALNLEKGDAVADIGAGTGLFMVAMSNAVGEKGKVYSIDISKAFLKHLRERKAELKLENVEPVLCQEDAVSLPEGSINVAFVCDTYHHFEFPRSTLKSILSALKPGGRLVVIDFKRIPGESREWILGHVRAGQEVFTSEIVKAGFEKVREIEITGFKENYCLEFRKPG